LCPWSFLYGVAAHTAMGLSQACRAVLWRHSVAPELLWRHSVPSDAHAPKKEKSDAHTPT
ncbi:MAG: hypothetical protein ACXWH0_16560, partial [Acidimicrobiia bacterium]